MNLIARLYDASEGTVRVGGVDVRDYDLDALRHQVAMVLQKNVLFSGTIADNLRWGDADATDERNAISRTRSYQGAMRTRLNRESPPGGAR